MTADREGKEKKKEKTRSRSIVARAIRTLKQGLGRTINRGVGVAVDLSFNSLEVLEIQLALAISALEAPFVEEFTTSGDLLQRIDGLVADITLGVGHYYCREREGGLKQLNQKENRKKEKKVTSGTFGSMSFCLFLFLLFSPFLPQNEAPTTTMWERGHSAQKKRVKRIKNTPSLVPGKFCKTIFSLGVHCIKDTSRFFFLKINNLLSHPLFVFFFLFLVAQKFFVQNYFFENPPISLFSLPLLSLS